MKTATPFTRPAVRRHWMRQAAKFSISWLADRTRGMAPTWILDVGAATGGRSKDSGAASVWAMPRPNPKLKTRHMASRSTREEDTIGFFGLLWTAARSLHGAPL